MRWMVVVLVAILEGKAHASWWYTYSCSGTCAPGQLAATYTRGPFGSYDACDADRSSNPDRYANFQSGSLGGLSLCSESDAAPSPSYGGNAGSAPPTQYTAIGLVGGPGYLRENDTSKPSIAGGIDAAFAAGGRPYFSLVLRAGLRYTHVPRPAINSPDKPVDAEDAMFVPLGLGATISPGGAYTRVEVGADFGFDIAAVCTTCSTGWWYEVRGGIAHYLHHGEPDGMHRLGVAVEVVKDWHDGGGVVAGPFMLRVSLRWRNDTLAW